MNNLINLDSAQPAPGIQSLGGKAASQRDGIVLFSAVLMQQMNGMGGNGAGETDSTTGSRTDLAQGLAGNASLVKLLPALLAQSKDSKSAVPANAEVEKALNGSDANPALATWIASILAAQTQPSPQSPALQLSGLSAQLSGTGTDQNSALQALEQQFSGLVGALKGIQIPGTKPEAGKLDAKALTLDAKPLTLDPKAPTLDPKAPTLDPKAPTLDPKAPTLDTKAPNLDAKAPNLDAKAPNVTVKNDFDATLNTAHALEPGKADPSQSPAHLSADAILADAKPLGASDKAKVEQKDLVTNPAGKVSQQELIQAGPQSKGADAKSQGQDSQPEQSPSGNQTKKDPSSSGQFQQPIGQASSSSVAAVTPADQGSLAAIAQATSHGVSANSSDHQTSSAPSQPLNVRGVESAVAVDAAPRIVHAARIMEAASQAEMRVSMKSETSGTVDVRALLEGDHISATVAAQHSGTRDWLMANMHELQTSLSRDDLNLRTFEVTDSALQNNGHGAEPKQQEQQQQRNSTYSRFTSEAHSTATSFDDIDLQENASRALSLLA
jgi:Flagellar hook-length control protein FliK